MKLSNLKVVSLLFLLLFATTSSTLIRATGLECHAVDPLFSRFEKCEMKALRRGVKEMNILARMLQLPITNVSIGTEIFRRGYMAQSIHKFEIDGCQFFRNKRRNPVANAVYDFLSFGSRSNLNHTCPYNHDLILDRLKLDKNWNLALPIGKGEYVIKSYWIAFNVLRAIITFFIQISD